MIVLIVVLALCLPLIAGVALGLSRKPKPPPRLPFRSGPPEKPFIEGPFR